MKCELEKITIHYETFGEGKLSTLVNEWLDRAEESAGQK